MNYTPTPNLVLEALVYLGLRANSYDQEYLETRLYSKGHQDLSHFRRRYAPFAQLQDRLARQVSLPEELTDRLFRDLGGLAINTGGAYSVALLLLAPAACQWSGDLEGFLAQMSLRSREQVARDILISFDLSHLLPPGEEGCGKLLEEQIGNQSLTPRGRRSVMEAWRGYPEFLRDAAQCLEPVYAALKDMEPELRQLAEDFGHRLDLADTEHYLRSESGFQLKDGKEYTLRPLLIGPSVNAFFDMADPAAENVIYCGVLQEFLRGLLKSAVTTKNHIFNCLHLLGDQTRFDIFCYLLDHPAYGQELSDHFGLARNTIHHHMNKLFDAGLVRCMVKGTRVYYSIDRAHFANLLEQQKQLFLGEQEK